MRRILVLPILVLLAAGCSADSSDEADPPTCIPPVLDGRLYFSAPGLGGQLDVFMMDAEGTGRANVSNTPAAELSMATSPDGSRVAFETDRDGNTEIYYGLDDGSQQTNISASPATDHHVTWSPDGQYLVFSSDRDGSPGLYRFNFDTRELVRIVDQAVLPSVAPTSDRVVFSRPQPGDEEIVVARLDGSDETQLTDSPGSDAWPRWSPDGETIVFESDRDGNPEIYRMSADGGTDLRRLTDDPGEDRFPTWSPNGQSIAYEHDGELWIMNADGSCAAPMHDPPVEGRFAYWIDD